MYRGEENAGEFVSPLKVFNVVRPKITRNLVLKLNTNSFVCLRRKRKEKMETVHADLLPSPNEQKNHQFHQEEEQDLSLVAMTTAVPKMVLKVAKFSQKVTK